MLYISRYTIIWKSNETCHYGVITLIFSQWFSGYLEVLKEFLSLKYFELFCYKNQFVSYSNKQIAQVLTEVLCIR